MRIEYMKVWRMVWRQLLVLTAWPGALYVWTPIHYAGARPQIMNSSRCSVPYKHPFKQRFLA